MHNFSTTGASAEPVLSNNMSIINTAYDNEAYHHWVPASSLEDSGDTGIPTYHIGDMTSGTPPYWELVSGASTSVGFYVKRHGEWKDGVLSVTPHYSCSGTNGNVVWNVSMALVENLTTPVPYSLVLSKLAPTVANEITTVDLRDPSLSPVSVINTKHIGVMVSLGLSVTVESAGDVKLYGLDLVYRESRRVVGGK